MTTIICGRVRFTIITDICIRIEDQQDGKFIDAPSWFAVNRERCFQGAKIVRSTDRVVIDTGKIRLTYRLGDKPISAANCVAAIKYGNDVVHWRYGQRNQFNLGGTLQTLDDVSMPEPLPEGLLSRDGWYFLDDSNTHLWVNDWIEPRPEGHGCDGYLFGYGRDFKGALQSLTAIGGAVPMPRKYILGSWYSRWFPYTDEDYRQIVKEYEEHDFPLDIMVMDMDWHERRNATTGRGWCDGMLGWTGWTWDDQLIKEPEALLRWYHARHLYVTLNVHPHDGVRHHEQCYPAFMKQLGEDPASGHDLPFRAGDLDYMKAYFRCAHGPLEQQGVDFWWVDWQQDSIMPEAEGIKGMKHLPLLNYLYYRHSEEGNKRGLSFSRWAGWGDHRYPIHFSGDATCNWDMLAFEVFFTATAGNVGCCFWSHDIGGFHGERDGEQYARWVQFGITSAAVRLHSTGDELDRRPWKWAPEIEESIRRSFRLRSELIPYIYSQVWQCHTQAMPLNRPMYLEYPELESAYLAPSQYLFGEALLVAPVITPGTDDDGMAESEVWLPAGTWYNWFSGEKYSGNNTIRCRVFLNEFPLFVKGGYPVCLQPYTRRMTSEPLSVLRIRCGYQEDAATAELYEDDGVTSDYRTGNYALTRIDFTASGNGRGRIAVTPCIHDWTGQVSARRYILELFGFDGALTVKCRDRVYPLKYNAGAKVAFVELPEFPTDQAVVMTVE